jgi:hypothetical protein
VHKQIGNIFSQFSTTKKKKKKRGIRFFFFTGDIIIHAKQEKKAKKRMNVYAASVRMEAESICPGLMSAYTKIICPCTTRQTKY